MFPQHHLPQLIPNRIQSLTGRLQNAIWQNLQQLTVEATAADPRQRTIEEASQLPREEMAAGTSWGKLFDQRWFRVVIPATEGDVWLNWRDQGEATVYVDGFPHFGFDVAHRHCRITGNVGEVWVESHCIQSAIWHPEATGLKAGSLHEGAFLCRRNDAAWEAYHDIKCLFDLAMDMRVRENPGAPRELTRFGLQPALASVSPLYRRLLRLMDEAADALDLYGLEAFREKMRLAYEEVRMSKVFTNAVLTGHAHIDLVWIWPERIGEAKAMHTFASMNHLLEEYPEFRFTYSQPASYEAIRRRSPRLYKQVTERMATGQWQATGAMYVESDTMMACGEALTRSFILGQKGFIEMNGAPSRLTWLPDVFGYSVCLPQIMKQMGVEYFFTTKMTWNAINRIPFSSFVWRGNDGSEILSHVTQDGGYNSQLQLAEIKSTMNGHQQADIHPEYLLPTGFGDGGGGTTAEMCERARRLDSLPGLPGMKWDQPEAFFDRLAPLRARLPVHQGEFYLEYHRGTFTTHGNLKETFRALERSLQVAEAVASVTGQRWDTEAAWKRLVFAQFHDYIPGTSVWDVYLEGLPELQRHAAQQQQKALEALSMGVTSEDDGQSVPCLFNPHAISVDRMVVHPQTGKRVCVCLPPLSGVPFNEAVLPSSHFPPVRIEGLGVGSGETYLRLNNSGWIEELMLGGRSVDLAGSFGQLVLYPDRPADFDAWDIDRPTLSLGSVCDAQPKIEPFHEGDDIAGFRVTRQIGLNSTATVVFSLERVTDFLDITVELDWQEPEHLLKMRFPTRYAAVNARFGSPFGSVLRSQIPNSTVSDAMWEVPFSRYLAVFDEGERDGIFLVTECKYGAYVKSGEIGLSLVRSPLVTGFEMHSGAWPPHLSRLDVPSRHSDIGKHRIRLAIGRYDITSTQPAEVAETHFTDPVLYRGAAIPSPLKLLTGCKTLVPAWAKPAGSDEWILRLHETAGFRGTARIEPAKGWQISQTDLAEQSDQPLAGGAFAFTPYQIVSLRFRKG
ncbi:MAG: alpha-mannosidase [Candidatus Methylacidiphilales bacterium]